MSVRVKCFAAFCAGLLISGIVCFAAAVAETKNIGERAVAAHQASIDTQRRSDELRASHTAWTITPAPPPQVIAQMWEIRFHRYLNGRRLRSEPIFVCRQSEFLWQDLAFQGHIEGDPSISRIDDLFVSAPPCARAIFKEKWQAQYNMFTAVAAATEGFANGAEGPLYDGRIDIDIVHPMPPQPSCEGDGC